MALNYRHAIYAGSFDPITLGHTAIIERAAMLFDKVTVAVGINVAKTPLFSLDERVALAEASLAHVEKVEVGDFRGLLIEHAQNLGAGVLVRGLRALTDFDGEFQLALANRDLHDDIETVFLMTNAEFVYVSSSLIKEIAKNGGDFDRYVPVPVRGALADKYR